MQMIKKVLNMEQNCGSECFICGADKQTPPGKRGWL